MVSLFIIMFLIALISDIDVLAVGISYGTRKIHVPFISNLLIALITGIGTYISMFVGSGISNVLNPKTASNIGAGIIIIVGAFILFGELNKLEKQENSKSEESIEKKEISRYSFFGKIPKVLENPFLADWDFSGFISTKEAFVLGSALAINNMANGIGAGMAGLSPIITAIMASIISLFFTWIGVKIGHDYVSSWLGKFASPMAALLLIMIGLYEIIS